MQLAYSLGGATPIADRLQNIGFAEGVDATDTIIATHLHSNCLI